MSPFDFSQEELLSFFAVLTRFSVMIALLPFVGDRFIPAPAKILLSVAITIALFPALLRSGQVKPADAYIWGATTGGIVGTIGIEVLFGLAMGYVSRLLFDAITLGANLAGNFMGFAAASMYDPHQEAHTQVTAELQLALAMMIFLALDGHHLMLEAALDSYRIVGMGQAGITAAFAGQLIEMTGQVIRFGLQISAPVAISLFAVNVAFGVVAKTMPQMNVLVLSFSVTALVGIVVMLVGMPEFSGAVGALVERVGDWLRTAMEAMAVR